MIHKIHYGINLANGYRVIGYGGTPHDYSNIVFPQDVRNCTTCHQESDTDRTTGQQLARRCRTALLAAPAMTISTGLRATTREDTCSPTIRCAPCATAKLRGPPALQVATVHQIPEAEAAKAFEYEVVSVTGTAPGDISDRHR